MRTVLGIDAAWTGTQPSGVALAEETERGWRLKAVASSYARFEALAGLAPEHSCAARDEARRDCLARDLPPSDRP